MTRTTLLYPNAKRALRKLGLTLCVLITMLTVQFADVAPAGATNTTTSTSPSLHSGPKGSFIPPEKGHPANPSMLETMPRVGLNTGDQMDAPALDNAGASGARVARVSVYWSSIEPSNTDPSH